MIQVRSKDAYGLRVWAEAAHAGDAAWKEEGFWAIVNLNVIWGVLSGCTDEYVVYGSCGLHVLHNFP